MILIFHSALESVAGRYIKALASSPNGHDAPLPGMAPKDHTNPRTTCARPSCIHLNYSPILGLGTYGASSLDPKILKRTKNRGPIKGNRRVPLEVCPLIFTLTLLEVSSSPITYLSIGGVALGQPWPPFNLPFFTWSSSLTWQGAVTVSTQLTDCF
jgi:hypothetical protein